MGVLVLEQEINSRPTLHVTCGRMLSPSPPILTTSSHKASRQAPWHHHTLTNQTSPLIHTHTHKKSTHCPLRPSPTSSSSLQPNATKSHTKTGYAKIIICFGLMHRFFSHRSWQCSRLTTFLLGCMATLVCLLVCVHIDGCVYTSACAHAWSWFDMHKRAHPLPTSFLCQHAYTHTRGRQIGQRGPLWWSSKHMRHHKVRTDR